MKKDERTTEHPHGLSIKIDWDKVEEVKASVENAMKNNEFLNVDCFTALCILAIEIAYNGNITKPQFLAKISQWWEELDNQVNG